MKPKKKNQILAAVLQQMRAALHVAQLIRRKTALLAADNETAEELGLQFLNETCSSIMVVSGKFRSFLLRMSVQPQEAAIKLYRRF